MNPYLLATLYAIHSLITHFSQQSNKSKQGKTIVSKHKIMRKKHPVAAIYPEIINESIFK